MDLTAQLGPVTLRSPLIAASGTVGAVDDWVKVGAPEAFGAAVAKSVSADPWPGRPPPRLAPVGAGMLNGIGIQNPGIEAWAAEHGGHLGELGVPVWGSAVGRSPEEYAVVAKGLAEAGVGAVEVNLSCPNLEDGRMFALDAGATARVVSAARSAVDVPSGGQALTQRRGHRRCRPGGSRLRRRLAGAHQHRVGGRHRPGHPEAGAVRRDRRLLGPAAEADRAPLRARGAAGPCPRCPSSVAAG